MGIEIDILETSDESDEISRYTIILLKYIFIYGIVLSVIGFLLEVVTFFVFEKIFQLIK